MAKRYHHSKPNEYYAGHHDRRRMEMEDAGMITEDKSAIANLPQDVKIRPWGEHEAYLPEMLDDTIRGIDKQIEMDDSKRKQHFMPKKV